MDKPVDMTPLFERSHIINLALVLIIVVIGLPLAIFLPRKIPAQIAGDSLQMLAFNPTISGQRASLPHIEGQAIVRFNEAVDIKTKSGTNQNGSFTPDDITGGLPSNYLETLKTIPVSSLKRIGPAPTSGSLTANKYVSNIFLISFSPSADMTEVLDALCSNGSNTKYCEPDYKFALISEPKPNITDIQSAQQSPSDLKGISFGIVGAPLPADYSQLATTLNLPPISENQIMPDGESGSSPSSLNIAFYFHSALPDSKFLFAGACGNSCALSSLTQAIIYSVDKGSKIIYLDEQALFPQGIQPYSMVSAVYYAVSKKVGVLTGKGKYQEPNNSYRFLDKIISMVIKNVFADGNCTALGKIVYPCAAQGTVNVDNNDNKSFLDKAREAAKNNTGTNNPNDDKSFLDKAREAASNNTGTNDTSSDGSFFDKIRAAQSTGECANSLCLNPLIYNVLRTAANNTLDQLKNPPDAPTGPAEAGKAAASLGTGADNILKNEQKNMATTPNSGQQSGQTPGGGGANGAPVAQTPAAPAPPAAPVYNYPPLAKPGSYGGYNPPNAPLLGVPYSKLTAPNSGYSADPGKQYTTPGSPYGDGYGYGTMQAYSGGFQMVGFGYGNQSPTDPRLLSGDSTPIGQQSQQGGTRIEGGYIFGGNGQL